MAADSFTPTSYEDRGDVLYFRDALGVSKVVPKESESAILYLRRLNGATGADLDEIKEGDEPSAPTAVVNYEVEVELSAGELLTLNSNPKTIIQAPGAGKKIQVISASLFLDYNATAYADASMSEMVLAYKDENGTAIANIPLYNLITATEDGSLGLLAPNAVSAGADDKSSWENQPVVLYLTEAITTGDSPIKIKVVYRVDETSL